MTVRSRSDRAPRADPAPNRRVAVTGIGVITGSGSGADGLWRGLREARSPAGIVQRFDASDFSSRVAVEVDHFRPEDHMERSRARRLDRFGQFSIAAARQAMDDAGLSPADLDGGRVGVQIGSALGGIAHAEEQTYRFSERGLRGVDPRLALTVFCGASSCGIAIEFGFRGPNSTNAMSCASGTIAVGEAWRLVRGGEVDAALAGGVEAPLAPLTFGAFANIRAMSTRNEDPARACRPFDEGRDGFVMGEGAGILVLEEMEAAKRRGARIYAEIRGYGTTSDAHHMTAPRPDGSEASRAIGVALEAAGMPPGEVDYVNAHGSSTPLNDSTESLALVNALGARAREIPVTGTKPYHGHALGASGAIEAAICCLAIHRSWVPPTLNLESPGEGCDLDYVPGTGRTTELRNVLSTSFGFGGINAALVLGAPEGARNPGSRPG